MKQTNISLPEDLWERCKLYGVKKRMSLAGLVRFALLRYLEGEQKTVPTRKNTQGEAVQSAMEATQRKATADLAEKLKNKIVTPYGTYLCQHRKAINLFCEECGA